MSPEIITDYLERKASESPAILHVKDSASGQAFFVIDDPYDLNEFDKALRSVAKSPAMLFELADGVIDDQTNASYLNTVNCSFMVIDKKGDFEKVRDCRNRCYAIGKEIIKSILKDQREMNIIPDKMIQVPLRTNYSPVGPMDIRWYGYQFTLEFVGPDGFCG
ncbi:hypothetical protein [Sphingobacterium multivorum]|jgi:hypothetical protein|uniref:hypothetical protein n=1 Tax=Sphingobacterium multivorum TaxID=28454 RepID=UPI002A58FF9F|nr:hypothetical protein [Sphingobacterium multivorum]